MFNKQKFCHVASNNRNEQKIGVFVYKTTDDLATVTASGYFNEKIIDINLHDLIIHEKYDAIDRTKVERNLLCVTERTLTNVGTTLIKSKWETETEEMIEELPNTYLKKTGDTMSGTLSFKTSSSAPTLNISQTADSLFFFKSGLATSIQFNFAYLNPYINPSLPGMGSLGSQSSDWAGAYIRTIHVQKLNNGYDIAVPVTNSADTLALKSQVDDAANSGEQLYTTGVWYAKMYSATTIPAEAEVEGRNYADFSQVDGDNNPIIVVYTYTSGAWATTQTITPPANHNGYMTITSKIWDIQEQAGQQGGLVLWSHNQGTFTPYPRIVSFDSISVTGESTVTMPAAPVSGQIVNKDYVDTAISTTVPNYQSTQGIADTTWAATLTIELADDKTIYFVDATADTAITLDTTNLTIEAGLAKTVEIHVISGGTLPTITWTGIDGWLTGSITTPTDTNATSIFVVRVQQRPTDAVPTVIANYGGAY